MICRCCGSNADKIFLDLGASPASNSFLREAELDHPEPYYPLVVNFCESCFLVQVAESKSASEIFNSEYVYFSSTSAAFVQHAQKYVDQVVETLSLNDESFVVEAASNDGYLLQFFNNKSIPCLGVEPSGSTAKVAVEKGIETLVSFFGVETVKKVVSEKGHADLFIGNNVIAHVPDLNDFIGGIETLLKPRGTATIEFPHLLCLIEELQFDTVYHEHFSYFSLISISAAFERNGMYVYRVDPINIHGGTLRVYCAKNGSDIPVEDSYFKVLESEKLAGLNSPEVYTSLQPKVDALCIDFVEFLVKQKKAGAKIAAYGAAAKGNTMLNYCGVKPYLIDFVSDLTPSKQGKFLPGSRIPVYGEEKIAEERPDYIVILPWNWEGEIRKRLSFSSEWGAKLVTAVPSLKITEA